MQSTDLRIGNLVTAVLSNEIYKIDVWALRCIDDGNYQNSNYPKTKVFEPIPLTKEWLLKFGFEWSIWHQAWHKLSFIFNLSERGVGGYYMHMVKKNNEIICPEIIYVHQLQNLYFALTNEELTL